jgi:hypothetical protein
MFIAAAIAETYVPPLHLMSATIQRVEAFCSFHHCLYIYTVQILAMYVWAALIITT